MPGQTITLDTLPADVNVLFRFHDPRELEAQFAFRGPETVADAIDSIAPGIEKAPWPPGWQDWPAAQEAHRILARRRIATLPTRPPADWDGDGIVIAGGGRYWASTYVTVRMIRHVGCTLPIQVWYLGHAREMNERRKALLAECGVECVDADAVRHRDQTRTWGGWQMKPFAVYHAPFRRVLYLDADCYPVVDPTYLFFHPEVQAKGALFFPDCPAERLPPRTWEIFGLKYVDEPAFESGQFLIDKRACFRELLLARHLNDHSDFYYRWEGNQDPGRILYGDKDCLHFAWWLLNRPYAMFGRAAEADSGSESYLHRDGEGRLVFVHRCRNKFRLPGSQESFPTKQSAPATTFRGHLPHESFAHACLAELADLEGQTQAVAVPPAAAAWKAPWPVVLCVPTLNRYDLLPRLIASVRAGTVPPDRIIVIDNGGKCPKLDGVEVIRPGRNLGVATSWNRFLRDVQGLCVIANDDVVLHAQALDRLCRAAEADSKGLAFVAAGAGLWRWSLFAQKRESLDIVGPYDEQFFPAYYEDNDYEIRLRLVGRPAVEVPGVHFEHQPSSTGKALSPAEAAMHHHHYEWCKSYYIQKWGGLPGAERFAQPFDGKGDGATGSAGSAAALGAPLAE